MRLVNSLFKGLAVVLTVIGGIVIIWLVGDLIQLQLRMSSHRFQGDSLFFQIQITQLNLIRLFIASTVEIALFWLLLLLNVISRRRSLIATLTLFIVVGIVVFIAYSQSINILLPSR